MAGSTLTLELRHSAAVPVNDSNSDAAAGYTVAHLGVRFQQERGPWQLRQFLRIDNLANRRHAGAVIVNEGNQRYYEPAPGRNWTVGLGGSYRF